MNPPVEAPRSIAVAAVRLDLEQRERVRELLAAARDEARRPLDDEVGVLRHLVARLVVAGHEPGEHERLRLRAALRQPALDEQDVEPLLQRSKGSGADVLQDRHGIARRSSSSGDRWRERTSTGCSRRTSRASSSRPGVTCSASTTRPRRHACSRPKARALLAAQRATAASAIHAYDKWGGRALDGSSSLVELGESLQASRAASPPRRRARVADGQRAIAPGITTIAGLTRRCASQEGNALAVCSGSDWPAIRASRLLAESLVGWQWPDGGWNCDKKASGHRSSFNESLPPMWGLHEYWAATGESAARDAARRTAELFLEHRLFRALATGEPIHESFVTLHYPSFCALRRPAERSSCSPGWGSPATRARPTGSTCSRTAPRGRPLARRRALVEASAAQRGATSRYSTGAAAPVNRSPSNALRVLHAARSWP